MKRPLLLVLGVLMIGLIIWSYAVPDVSAPFLNKALARILFWHLPCAILTTIMLVIGAWFSFRALQTRAAHWDVRGEAANELGFMFALATMASGMLFSLVQWNAWWSWDPRQTSFLLVLLIYAAYFALRGAFTDDTQRAKYAAAYSLAAIGPALFLVFVFPRLPHVVTLHPNQSILKGEIAGVYRTVLISSFALISVLGAVLYRQRIRVGLMELLQRDSHGKLADLRGDTAATGVVRTVDLPRED